MLGNRFEGCEFGESGQAVVSSLSSRLLIALRTNAVLFVMSLGRAVGVVC